MLRWNKFFPDFLNLIEILCSCKSTFQVVVTSEQMPTNYTRLALMRAVEPFLNFFTRVNFTFFHFTLESIMFTPCSSLSDTNECVSRLCGNFIKFSVIAQITPRAFNDFDYFRHRANWQTTNYVRTMGNHKRQHNSRWADETLRNCNLMRTINSTILRCKATNGAPKTPFHRFTADCRWWSSVAWWDDMPRWWWFTGDNWYWCVTLQGWDDFRSRH